MDLVPEEAIEAAAVSLAAKVDQGMPVPGYLRGYARDAVEAAAPLILAADYDGRAWAYDAAAGEFAKRAERLMSEQPEGFQAMADRLVGRAIALEHEASALRFRASVLRGEGDPK